MNIRQNIILVVMIFILVCLSYFIAFGDRGLIDLKQLQQTHNSMVTKNTQLNKENEKLLRLIKRLKDDYGYIESVARRELGVIAENEMIFRLKNKE